MVGIIRPIPKKYKHRDEEEEKIQYLKSLTDDKTFNFLQKIEEHDFYESTEVCPGDIKAAKDRFHKMNPDALHELYPEVAPFTSEITFAIVCGQHFHIERWGNWIYLVLTQSTGTEFLVSMKRLKREV